MSSTRLDPTHPLLQVRRHRPGCAHDEVRVDLVLRGRPVVVLDRELGSNLGEFAHEGNDAHDLARELAGGGDADGLGKM